ncbi:glycosyltransferase family 2 protein [Desulfotignum phosphitoxidans]|uniref:Glycosyl transferase family 2 n=1 Tax=Desulfotignum phosphitoxidans DSM 13687 TaxID=1286635 RepID=S0G1F0_9BACT|nr:glycosyltransferase family A protein [Desulfotignum phosphitoxidans]EMS79284.1 glycosyl transferase family 2 [Desulfotignum phosphitoxidans DSM 13687]
MNDTQFSGNYCNKHQHQIDHRISRVSQVFIVIPVHNRAAFVERSVKSVLNQTYPFWKLVIVDDHSTDNSMDIIRDLAANDPRITCKTNSEFTHSAAGARKSGLLEMKGDFIAFLDSDDVWPNYHLAEFVNFLERKSQIDVIFGDLQRRNLDGSVVTSSKFKCENGLPKELISEEIEDYIVLKHRNVLKVALDKRFTIGLQSALFRRRVFEHLELRDEIKIGEDFVFTLEMITVGFKLAASRNIHIFYTIHNDNISGCNASGNKAKSIKISENEIRLYQQWIPRFIELSSKERRILKSCVSRIYVWNLANAIYRESGDRSAAMRCILKGIFFSPLNLRYWKSLFGTLIKG